MKKQQGQNPHPFLDNSIFATVEFIIGLIAKTIVVFLRFDFGERYFNIGMFGAVVAFFILFSTAGTMFFSGLSSTSRPDPSGFITPNFVPLGAFILGFLAMCFVHKIAAWVATRMRRRWHSYYSGTSFITQFIVYLPKENLPKIENESLGKAISFLNFLIPDPAFFVKRFIEPLIAIVIGFLIGTTINGQLGFWLIFSGFCLGVHEQLLAMHQRSRMLDAIDAQIEADHLAGALSGKQTPRMTEGFVLPVPKYFSQEQREKLASGMRRLEPALEAILDKPETEAEENHAAPGEFDGMNELDPELESLFDNGEETEARKKTPPSPFDT